MLDGEPSKHAHVCTPSASPRLLNPEPRKGVAGLMALMFMDQKLETIVAEYTTWLTHQEFWL